MKDSLKNLLNQFPYFLNKNEGSNFVKSQMVTNEQFKNLSNDLHNVYRSFHLNKRCLIWKEQSVSYEYLINFIANYPHLKSVKCFKDDILIYSEEYSFEDNRESFEYTYNNVFFKHDEWTSEGVISSNIYVDSENVERINLSSNSLQGGQFYANSNNLVAPYSVKFTSGTVTDNVRFIVKLDGENYYHGFKLSDYEINYADEVLLENTGETINLYVNGEFKCEIGEDTPTGVQPISTLDNPHKVGFSLSNSNYFFFDFMLLFEKDIIPTNLFHVLVETYDEYVIKKGFPENDEFMGNMFDHDTSLDEIGALHDIPRKKYILVDESLYPLTEPPFNNQLSEDDYHYMNRIIGYLVKMHTVPLPVAEIWKLYGLDVRMENREKYLLKLFDLNKHLDSEGNIDLDWVPQRWAHKDTFYDYNQEYGEYFFVQSNTNIPIEGQDVFLTFSFLNHFAEPLRGDYTVDIYKDDTLITTVSDMTQFSNYRLNHSYFSDTESIFTFEGKNSEGELIGSIDLTIINRGCATGDWYVSTNGNDSNTGSRDAPFATVYKALQNVTSNKNFIVILDGEYSIPAVATVHKSCSILGCSNVTLNHTWGNRFFSILPNMSLTLQNVGLRGYEASTVLIENNTYNNFNANQNVFVTVEKPGKPRPTLTLEVDHSSISEGESITLSGVLGTVGDVKIMQNGVLIDTVSTDVDGEFSKTVSGLYRGSYSFTAVFDGDEEYDSVASSPVSVIVSAPSVDALSVRSSKDTLSYVERGSCTLYCQLMSEGSPVAVEGETVTFNVFKVSDDSLVETLTDDTDGTGLASVSYSARDVGDVYVVCECMSLQKRYENHIEDCYFYDSLTSDNSRFALVQGTATLQYTTDGLRYTGTATTDCIHKLNCELPSEEYTIECDVTEITGSGYSTGVAVEDTQILKASSGLYARRISTSTEFFNRITANAPFHLEWKVTGSNTKTIQFYKDEVLLGTGTPINQTREFLFRSYSGRYITIKDLKIKPL